MVLDAAARGQDAGAVLALWAPARIMAPSLTAPADVTSASRGGRERMWGPPPRMPLEIIENIVTCGRHLGNRRHGTWSNTAQGGPDIDADGGDPHVGIPER